MASVLSSFFSRDPKAQFPFELPAEHFAVLEGVFLGDSRRKVSGLRWPDARLDRALRQGDLLLVLDERAQSPHADPEAEDSAAPQRADLPGLAGGEFLVRRPSLLQAEDTVYLITEYCVPLRSYFEATTLEAAKKELYVSWGLYQVLVSARCPPPTTSTERAQVSAQ